MNDPDANPPDADPLSDATQPRVIGDGTSDPDRTAVRAAPLPTNTVDYTPSDGSDSKGASPPEPTVAVPEYEVLDVLGKGGMGVVYKARQTKLNRVVALKQLKAAGGGRESTTATFRFLAEAEAIAAIKHENVVQVFDFGEMNGQQFMALEFCSGGTLGPLLPKGPTAATDPRKMAALVARVARGVAAAHALGLVHRDLKPTNVLLDENGVPKVADFGLAKRVADTGTTPDAGAAQGTSPELTVAGTINGTPAYMAPEQAVATRSSARRPTCGRSASSCTRRSPARSRSTTRTTTGS
jgi:serine/threonine-protein kinase